MIITDLYQTQIDTVNHEVFVGTSNIEVSVKLVDFNGYGVAGKEVQLSVNKGYFTECTGKTTQTFSNTSTKTVTAISDNSGKIVAKYTASESGFATFTANNMKMAISVTKWTTQLSTDFASIKTNGQIVSCYLHSPEKSVGTNWTKMFNVCEIYGDYLLEYMPPYTIYGVQNDGIEVRLFNDGTFQAFRKGSGKNAAPNFYAVYLKKGM